MGQQHTLTSDEALTAAAADFSGRFAKLLGGHWSLQQALALHEELDSLAGEADAVGDGELCEKAITFSVYLCSFMEEGREPDAAQREHLARLNTALAGEHAATFSSLPVPPAAVASSAPPVRALLCISSDSGLINDLTCRMLDADIAVLARGSVEEAISRPAESPVDAVIIDAPELADFSRRARAFGHAYQSSSRRISLLALARTGELTERMFALRAGADEVIPIIDGVDSLAARITDAVDPGQLQPFRVLIVDDDRSQTLFCEAILRSQNVDTRICTEPQLALQEVERFQPEVVLLDLYMPEIDGMELAGRIRSLPGSEFISIVFLSGDQELDVRFDVLAAGGDDYFTKPIQPRHLVTGVISRARRARALARRLSTREV
jgi:CheY-like chemotaxis protein